LTYEASSSADSTDSEGDRGVEYWLTEIAKAQRAPGMKSWHERCNSIHRLYRDDQTARRRKRRYATLWSNMETMKPASYTKPPIAVVQRRYRDSDPVGRMAVEVLERAINFTLETNDFDSKFKQVRDDFLLYGRGVARVRYDPVLSTVPDYDDESGLDITSMEGPQKEAVDEERNAEKEGNPDQVLKFENVKIWFVQRQDFVHQEARTWDEVDWVAFRGFLNREGLVERFGEKIGNQISVNVSETYRKDDYDLSAISDKAEIWEIWDRCHEEVLWISKGFKEVLDRGSPYLKLEDFYPCPRPAYGTLTNESLDPIPDYVYYQDQAEEIDRLTARIGALTDALKLVGFYPGGPQGDGAPEIEKALTPGYENRMIAVKSWDAFKQGGGGQGAPIVMLPMGEVAEVLKGCVELRKQLLDDINQIYGISDIMRGDGDANETATAQSIKAQYGSVRIRSRQQELARFCRDISRMTGEIIATHFQPETLLKMVNIKLPTKQDVMMLQQKMQLMAAAQAGRQAGMAAAGMPGPNGQGSPGMPGAAGAGPGAAGMAAPMPPAGMGSPAGGPPPQPPNPGPTIDDVMALLRDNVLRHFRIDIEADSTIVGDESQERQDRNEFIASVTKFVEVWGPIVAAQPAMAQLAGGLLQFGVRAYRVGRELEELIEETIIKAQQMPPQPHGKGADKAQSEMIKLQGTKIKTAAEVQKSQIDAQNASFAAGLKAQDEAMKHQVDIAKINSEYGKNAAAQEKAQAEHVKAGAAHVKAHADTVKAGADLVTAMQPPAPPQNKGNSQ
jgi:hypothetical protein